MKQRTVVALVLTAIAAVVTTVVIVVVLVTGGSKNDDSSKTVEASLECCTLNLTDCTDQTSCNENADTCINDCGGLWENKAALTATGHTGSSPTFCCSLDGTTCVNEENDTNLCNSDRVACSECGGNFVQNVTCPKVQEGAVPLTTTSLRVMVHIMDTDNVLCMLWRVHSDGRRHPVAKSYQGNVWEASAVPAYGYLQFDCDEAMQTCQTELPPINVGDYYEIVSLQRPDLPLRDQVARFLEQTTFGPRTVDLQDENVQAFPSFADWVRHQQVQVPLSSHRRFVRERLNHRAVAPSPLGVPTHACRAGTRYRKYAFSDKDTQRMLQIQTSADNQKILSIDGQIRTVLPVEQLYAGPRSRGVIFEDGFYVICSVENELGGRFALNHPEVSGCQMLVASALLRGNPPIVFNDNNRPTNDAVNLTSHVAPVDERFYPNEEAQELFLTTDLDDAACAAFPPVTGLETEFVVVGIYDGQPWIHDPRFVLQENTVDNPLMDGGGALRGLTEDTSNPAYQVACSNVPRTFLNEDGCRLTNDANFCEAGSNTNPTVRVRLTLNQDLFHQIYQVSNGESYFYAVTGLRQEKGRTPYDPPCTASALSRWVPIDDCSLGLAATQTSEVFAALLRQTDQSNRFMRDVVFPAADIFCDESDAKEYNLKIQMDGECWLNVHQSHLQVYDFSQWVRQHPGGPDPIRQFAGTEGNYTINFPSWHDMSRWYGQSANGRDPIGRNGDQIVTRLPAELARTLNVTILGDSEQEQVMSMLVCGSPDESSNIPELHGSLTRGAFDAITPFNQTTPRRLSVQQKLSSWIAIALTGEDQLRQRVAFALAQLLVVSPGAIDQNFGTEIFTTYYDIFVRNAFGNYRDILKEVSHSPLMGEMLSYRGSRSTASVFDRTSRIEYADENYAREVMQLFSVGLYALHNNGTRILDAGGRFVETYTNDDISEYARVWTGFQSQNPRGNIEDPSFRQNRVDPMLLNLQFRDSMPKMGLNRRYVGDGLPLCADLPDRHFLRPGAMYRLLGSAAVADLVKEDSTWAGSENKVRLHLRDSSRLFKLLCNSDDGSATNCRHPGKLVLQEEIPCTALECQIESPRIVGVNGVFYEYIHIPCAHLSFYDSPRTLRTTGGVFYCGNPDLSIGGTNCCGGDQERTVDDFAVFSGERNPFNTASNRCASEGLSLCGRQRPNCRVDCDPIIGYWTSLDCRLGIKINSQGNIAVVHEVADNRIPIENVHRSVRQDTKTFFRVDWEGPIESFLSSYATSCSELGCIRDSYDNLCLCSVTVANTLGFSELPTREQILSDLHVGAIPNVSNPDLKRQQYGDIVVYEQKEGELTINSIFEVIDDNGRVQWRKNLWSEVVVGSTDQGILSFRNPSHIILFTDPELRDVYHETDAAIDHYFFHSNTAPFLAVRFLKRFGHSNPSPRYVDVVATAFRKGFYIDDSTGIEFGSNEYGDMSAFIAALLLDREARSVLLDVDPTHGACGEPFLKLLRVMRSLEFSPNSQDPLVFFGVNLQEIIGQQPYEMPSVFSFFLPEHQPAGVIGEADLSCPECQVLTGQKSVDLTNGILSLLKYGLTSAHGGFGTAQPMDQVTPSIGENRVDTSRLSFTGTGLYTSRAIIDELATLLTSGRLSSERRELLVSVYENSLAIDGQREAFINVQQLISLTPEFHTRGLVQDSQDMPADTTKADPSSLPYKAIVNVFLEGGYDSFNLLVPLVCDGTNAVGTPLDQQYDSERGELAFSEVERFLTIKSAGTNQPCSDFAIHDEMTLLKELYDDGDLLFVANMGVIDNVEGMTKANYQEKTSVQLFAHNTMQYETRRVDPKDVTVTTGVLGRMAEMLTANGFTTNSISIDDPTVMVTARTGKAPAPVVVSRTGVNTFGEKPVSEKFNVTSYAFELNRQTGNSSSFFGKTWSERFTTGIYQAESLKKILDDTQLGSHWPTADVTELGQKFGTLSRLIQARNGRGADRDFMHVAFGSWDHHFQLKSNLRSQFAQLNQGLQWLVQELKEQGLWESVAIVISSDFARTITPNSGGGSDHGWAGHYFIMGGAVKGGRILGQYPEDLTPSGPLNLGRGRLLPTTSWDCLWNGAAQWLGIEADEDLDFVLPNRFYSSKTSTDDNSMFSALFTQSDLFATASNDSRGLRG